MQNLARRLGRCSWISLEESKRRTRSFSSINSVSSFPTNHSCIGDHDSVLVEGNASSRTVVLNRPSSLNALNTSMLRRLQELYESWEDNPNVGFVVMKGSGRAFCSGGDIVSIHDMIKIGNIEGCKEVFRRLYTFIYLVHTYKKPTDKKGIHVLPFSQMRNRDRVLVPPYFTFCWNKKGKLCLIDIPMHAKHGGYLEWDHHGWRGWSFRFNNIRVATDKTVYATPETLIGLHADAGASYHLSRLPGYLGEYLALTGERLNGVEMVACRLATHYSHGINVWLIEECLKNLITSDRCVIKTSLEKIKTINDCFSHDTVEEIIDTLIREGRYRSLDQCLIREYRMSLQAISHDFYEGVRARMVDKDYAPKWDPPSLEHVSQDMVDQYFSPLNSLEPELSLKREASCKQVK